MTLLMSGIVGLLVYLGSFSALEKTLYASVMHAHQQTAASPVAMIVVDAKARQQLGYLSDSRSQYAQVIADIAQQAQVIGVTLDLSQPQRSPGLHYVQALQNTYQDATALRSLPKTLQELDTFMQALTTIRTRLPTEQAKLKSLLAFYDQSILKTDFATLLTTLETELNQAQIDLDTDKTLARSLQNTNNVLLGMHIDATPAHSPLSQLDKMPEYPASLVAHQLQTVQRDFELSVTAPQPPVITQFNAPLAEFSSPAAGIGLLVPPAQYAYQQPLVLQALPATSEGNSVYFPSLPLLLAVHYLGGDASDIEVSLGRGIKFKHIRLNTDAQLRIYPFFYPTVEFPTYSLVDVLTGQVNPSVFEGKIVLLGDTTRPELSQYANTPLGAMPPVAVVAHTLTSLLNQHNLLKPTWALVLHSITLALVFSYLALILARLRAKTAFILTSLLLLGLLGLNIFLLYQGWVVFLSFAIGLLISGYTALFLKKAIIAYQDAFRLHPDAVESNRLLGLAFQGQGHLDMAFEKYRLCPPDDAILGLLYNLALDYEMKRQFNGAAAVYRYMLSHTQQFRDVEKRLERLYRLRKPQVLGGRGVTTQAANDLTFDDSSSGKRTLGRYQVERQLGKGAMGLVYLGRDPKLDRLVAIKTLALSQEFEGEELQEATRRFFREASAAGRLKHPDIVTIYDAGEEQDLAYISMEFFKGGNLLAYCKPDNLLPVPTVIDITIKVADALDYAFRQGVVHRDIKPANIMYNPASGKIKITDFGIARITDSNKTRTGVILGTPSYMSPEQLVGKQVDGRTDIFSLGVMLYQLLTGKLPFMADTIASLMYKIANEPHQSLCELRADIPLCLAEIANKALAKAAQHRFQTGADLAQALRDCQREILQHAQLDTEQDLSLSASPPHHQSEGEH